MRLKKSDIARILLYALAIGFLAYIQPVKIDWTETYSIADTKPYGIRAFYDLYTTNNDQEIKLNENSLFETLSDSTISNTDLFIINPNADIDKLDGEKLLDFIDRGNDCFLASHRMSNYLYDTLDVYFSMSSEWKPIDIPEDENIRFCIDDTLIFDHPKSFFQYEIVSIDNENLISLGEIEEDVFLAYVEIGKGKLYFCSTPNIFTNYHLLNSDGRLVQHMTSYLDADTILFDQYYINKGKKKHSSPFYALFEYPNFKWAYWLFILGLVLFYLVKARRLQRAIPTINPYKNTTTDFVETMAGLYYHEKDNRALGLKKIKFFKEHVAQRYFIKDIDFTRNDVDRLSTKLGVESTKIVSLFEIINKVRENKTVTDTQLRKMTKEMSWVYKL